MKNRKAKAAAAIISGLVITAIIITGAFFMFGKNRNHTVTDCSSLTLRLSGMRITEEYEITCDGEITKINHYYFTYSDGAEKRELVSTGVCPADEFFSVLNECNIVKWNGFYGEHPRGVTDGTMFDLTATVNGTEISAHGSQNFPKNFYVLENWLQTKNG
jgi:hypothetical protein